MLREEKETGVDSNSPEPPDRQPTTAKIPDYDIPPATAILWPPGERIQDLYGRPARWDPVPRHVGNWRSRASHLLPPAPPAPAHSGSPPPMDSAERRPAGWLAPLTIVSNAFRSTQANSGRAIRKVKG